MGFLPRLAIVPVLVSLMATACSAAEHPRAADGSAAPSAAPTASGSTWRPEVGQCHDAHGFRLSSLAYGLAGCAKLHVYQVVFVGEVAGDLATAQASPEIGTADQIKLWEQCNTGFTGYFGGDWKESRLKLKISFPSVPAWDAGQRWFSCHAAVVDGLMWINGSTTGSFENGAKSRPDLRLGCMHSERTNLTPKACDEPHNVEFVAVFPALTEIKDPFTATDLSAEHAACQSAIRRVVGTRHGDQLWSALDTDWKMGDHYMRCFLAVEGKPVTKSFKPTT